MGDLTDEEFEAANERGRLEMLTKPRALTARYDVGSGLMIIELTTDCTFTFPPRALQGLEQATDQQIADVEIMGMGLGLGWDELDMHFTVEGLMAGRFGTRRYMDSLRENPDYQRRMVRHPFRMNTQKDAA